MVRMIDSPSPATPLSVPLDRETADAARKLREWLGTPGGADLCAGVPTLDVGTFDRIYTAVAILNARMSMVAARPPLPPRT